MTLKATPATPQCRYCKKIIDGKKVKLGFPPFTTAALEYATCEDCMTTPTCCFCHQRKPTKMKLGDHWCEECWYKAQRIGIIRAEPVTVG